MIWFWISFGIDTLTLLIFLYFFVIGIFDRSVSSQNLGLWVLILLSLTIILISGFLLKEKGNLKTANLILSISAVPAMVFGLWILLMLLTNPRWN